LVDRGIAEATADTQRTGEPSRNARPCLAALERPTPAARRFAGVPAEALGEFPPAWGEHVRVGLFWLL